MKREASMPGSVRRRFVWLLVGAMLVPPGTLVAEDSPRGSQEFRMNPRVTRREVVERTLKPFSGRESHGRRQLDAGRQSDVRLPRLVHVP